MPRLELQRDPVDARAFAAVPVTPRAGVSRSAVDELDVLALRADNEPLEGAALRHAINHPPVPLRMRVLEAVAERIADRDVLLQKAIHAAPGEIDPLPRLGNRAVAHGEIFHPADGHSISLPGEELPLDHRPHPMNPAVADL